MTGSRFARLELLTGAVSIVLLFAAAVIVGIYEYLPPREGVQEFFAANSGRVSAGGYVGALGGLFLIWFAGVLRSVLRERERGVGRYSAIAYGGGVAAGVTLLIGFAVLAMAGARGGAAGRIGVEEAITLYDLWSGISGLALPISLGVLVGAATLAARLGGLLPAWAGWVGSLVAVASVSPVGYLAQTAAVVWVLAISVWLYARGGGRLSE